VFVPLGGVGEIGMNLYLYGYGPAGDREWLIVDLGITFGGETEPGVDVILPDIAFLEAERPNLTGLLLTMPMRIISAPWPIFGRGLAACPVYATPFTAAMLKSKLGEAGLLQDFPLHVVPLGDRRTIGPFDIELVNMSHSIPSRRRVIIRPISARSSIPPTGSSTNTR
jgi:ribonuclease J